MTRDNVINGGDRFVRQAITARVAAALAAGAAETPADPQTVPDGKSVMEMANGYKLTFSNDAHSFPFVPSGHKAPGIPATTGAPGANPTTATATHRGTAFETYFKWRATVFP